ncbi:hemerythrin domain-containing protein [Rhodococcus rhodnii]|uniref:Hemerythrin-like domain-containing protein n=2 Tax=Rhodococcus rhodnii TaxID=38312 RepID=R7WNI9_9NOCA|nr:hemerythrin domain-containing protein [Rhodococcus rhodnii]EOM76868.1 hypothetical protein Rrhod_1781 [Rhodococcus rhodnii LMG 5362]TXG89765.1 hemerythrin domain-containing protein [Rhodococcus rhodnii]
MADITDLIMEDHAWFREQFARLDLLRGDAASDAEALHTVWRPLADRLDLHAAAEEEIFYPQLLRVGEEDPAAETLDAIGDHNDIRDGVRDADAAPIGGDAWWDGVTRTRLANDEHMAEEEREGLADFRRTAAAGLRESLGRRFTTYFEQHPHAETVRRDLDPETYVDTVENALDRTTEDPSLGIGSLRAVGGFRDTDSLESAGNTKGPGPQ